jgi:hypothetical protein
LECETIRVAVEESARTALGAKATVNIDPDEDIHVT